MLKFCIEPVDKSSLAIQVMGDNEADALDRVARRRGFDTYTEAVAAGEMLARDKLTITRML